MPGVQRPLQPLQFHFGGIRARRFSCDTLVEPQSGTHFERTTLTLLVQQQDEVHGMHEVRSFPQQLFAVAQRFPYQIQLPVFQVT